MSGTRHHFLPRFLQEGFVSRRTSRHRYTWAYQKNGAVFEANINNVGVEGQFYSDENPDVDDTITSAEGVKFAPLVKALRDGPPGPVTSTNVADLVAHLEMRTRHFRQSFGNVSTSLVSKFDTFLQDENGAAEYFFQRFLRDGYREEARKMGIPPLLFQLASRARAAELKAALRPTIQAMLSGLRAMDIEAHVKVAHVASLRRAIVPEGRASVYRAFEYFVRDVKDALIILGDSAVVWALEGATRFSPLLDKDANVRAVYLPLTPNRVLVGTPDTDNLLAADFGEGSARCSLEFFIAVEHSDYHRGLQSMIGSAADMLTEDDMKTIFDEVIREGASAS